MIFLGNLSILTWLLDLIGHKIQIDKKEPPENGTHKEKTPDHPTGKSHTFC